MRKCLWMLMVLVALLVAEAGLAEANGYISLETIAQQKGLSYSYDPMLKNAVVSSAVGSVKFHAGSEFILSRGKLVTLDREIRFENGALSVPSSAIPYIESLAVPVYQAPKAAPVTAAAAKTSSYAGTHKIRRIVVDAGHGGKDFGAVSPRGTIEKHLVLEVARLVYSELRAAGLEVIMTRTSDVFIPLQGRTRIANKKSADFFVSIHANASLTRSLQGFEVYYLSEATDDHALALERAENSVLDLRTAQFENFNRGLKATMWDLRETENRRESIKMANAIVSEVQGKVQINKHRIKSARFFVLKWTECPAVLVEMGYMTNLEDEPLLRNSEYRRNLAKAIAAGILNYKNEFERTDGFTRE